MTEQSDRRCCRYRAFRLPKTAQWGVVDRNTGRYLLGIVAEDEVAAGALAFLLNTEHEKWRATMPVMMRGSPVAEPERVIVPFLFRRREARYSVGDSAVVPLPPKPQPVKLREYVAGAPESEQRLIAKLRRAAVALLLLVVPVAAYAQQPGRDAWSSWVPGPSACRAETVQHCRSVRPGNGRIVACLRGQSAVSAACSGALARLAERGK